MAEVNEIADLVKGLRRIGVDMAFEKQTEPAILCHKAAAAIESLMAENRKRKVTEKHCFRVLWDLDNMCIGQVYVEFDGRRESISNDLGYAIQAALSVEDEG